MMSQYYGTEQENGTYRLLSNRIAWHLSKLRQTGIAKIPSIEVTFTKKIIVLD